MTRSWRRIALTLMLGAPACRYSVDPNTGKFHCATDADCGGGWHCFADCPVSGFSAYCIQNGSCDPCPSLQADPLNCGSCGNACASNESCVDGTCVPAILLDGGFDAGKDAGPGDAGLDAGADAGRDAGSDGGLEDAGRDGGPDGGLRDAGADADAGAVDGGPVDAGAVDGGSLDAGPGDGGEDGGVDAGDAGD